MTKSKIEWADRVWNPVTGCTKVSEGCRHCYAESIARRFWGGRKFTDVQCHEDRLDAPLHWRKPARVFVNSMSDLFHEQVDFEFIDRVFAVMVNCEHTFMILTKRPARMKAYFDNGGGYWFGNLRAAPSNVWFGVSIEDQRTADERIPLLLQTPAAVRFVSYEPALGPVDLTTCRYDGVIDIDALKGEARGIYNTYPFPSSDMKAWPLDWVIMGGESGPGARPMHPDWARSMRDQCQVAGVPFFLKQLGGVKMPVLDGKVWAEYPGGPQ